MRYRFHRNCLFLIILGLAIILINLDVNCKSNLSKEILIFFLRQEIMTAPAMSLTISRNKICVIIKQYYMQLPLGQIAAPYCLAGMTVLGKCAIDSIPIVYL